MRALVVFGRLLPFVLAFLRDRRRFVVAGGPVRRTEADHRRRAERMTATIAGLGPTFIKLAQVFAARADILPPPYLHAIATLADQVPALPPGTAERVVREELGRPVGEVFERFEPAPLAAASLGQVHRARYQGRDVVVKVLRPGVEEMVQRDLDASFRILAVLGLLFPNHHVRAAANVVGEFANKIGEEMDFREEARNAGVIRANLAADLRVRIPDVLPELVTRRVLVLEYVEGTRIDRLQERLAAGELSLPALLATINELYLKMMLEDGVFHADPHPGNLLVDGQGRLVLLDFGMVHRVEQATRERLIAAVLAAIRQDVDGVINGFYELGLLDPEVDRAVVQDAAERLMAVAQQTDLSPRQVQRIVAEVLETFYQWPLMLPSEFVYFMRASVLVEGIALRYDPNFNGLPIIRPIVERFAARVGAEALADPGAKLQDWTRDVGTLARQVRDLVRRMEREELRVRAHPRDMLQLQRFAAQQVRRSLLALLAVAMALVTSVVFIAVRNTALLTGGLLASAGLFVVVFLLPSHLFQSPVRFRPRLPGR